jgi:uncharacterized coiled-coil protein SlyX
MDDDISDRFIDLEVKLAYQDRTIRELDNLVRELATRLEDTEKKLAQLEQTVRSGEVPLGPPNEPPPHY